MFSPFCPPDTKKAVCSEEQTAKGQIIFQYPYYDNLSEKVTWLVSGLVQKLERLLVLPGLLARRPDWSEAQR